MSVGNVICVMYQGSLHFDMLAVIDNEAVDAAGAERGCPAPGDKT